VFILQQLNIQSNQKYFIKYTNLIWVILNLEFARVTGRVLWGFGRVKRSRGSVFGWRVRGSGDELQVPVNSGDEQQPPATSSALASEES
jgi:hypothetical protein